jgi:predicted amidohydrolase YtcJ
VPSGIKTDPRQFADIFFRGGPIYTVDARSRVVDACAVRGDRIIGVGTVPELLHLVGPATRIVDLEGKCMVPGLIDAHCHITGQGFLLSAVDCKHDVASIDDIVAKVAAAAAGRPPGTWILGRGYDQKKLREGRHPDRGDLDRATPHHPVALTRTCGHIVACNSLALRLAGIDAGAADPPGGEILRDVAGTPTGVLLEAAATPIYALTAAGLDAIRQAYSRASEEYLGYGITSAHDASGGDPLQIRAMIEGQLAGDAKLRTYMMMRVGKAGFAGDAAIGSGLVTGLGSPAIRVGPLKVMLDGSSSGPTAATREPYACQADNRGILYFDQPTLDDIVGAGARAGFQMTSHSVGDLSISMMLGAIERSGPVAGRRHRIEHCAMLDPQLVAQIKALGVVPVANPVFLWEFGDGYVRDYGHDRASWMFAMKPLFDAGIPAAAGSDAPVTYVDPYLAMYCAMTRRTMRGTTIGPEHAVSFDEILRAYTINAAYASFEEGIKGSIETGKLADLAVIEPDLGRATHDAVRGARAVMTVLGGEVVFER